MFILLIFTDCIVLFHMKLYYFVSMKLYCDVFIQNRILVFHMKFYCFVVYENLYIVVYEKLYDNLLVYNCIVLF